MKRSTLLGLVGGLGLAVAGRAGATAGLTLEEAVSRVLAQHPTLQAASAQVAARKGAALQAGLRPNPEASLEFEELGAAGGVDALETTWSVSQALELGGKRQKRRRAATLDAELAWWDRETVREDLLEEVRVAFFEALAAQERLAQAQRLTALSERGLGAVKERVEAGKVSPVEETQARVALSSVRIDRRRAEVRWDAAKSRLVALWGGEAGEAEGLAGALTVGAPLPAEEELSALLSRSPEVARWETEVEQREAALEAARSLAVPDLTLSGGVRSFGAGEEFTGVAALSVPLPVFDRNQGGVAEARAEVEAARAERAAALRRARANLAETYRAAVAAWAEARTLRERLLPDAEAAFEAVREGYRLGKFDLLRLLDAQGTVIEARTRLLDAQEAFHVAETRLARRTGGSPRRDEPGSR